MHALQISTAEQGTQEWFKDRSKGVGASDAAAALGLSKWKTPQALWEEKRGAKTDPSAGWHFERGKALEPIIRQWYANTYQASISLPTGILVHPQHHFMLLSPDGIVADGTLLEAKVSYDPAAWGEPGTDEVPQEYSLQVQHALAVTGLERAAVVVSIMGNIPVVYSVAADLALQNMIIEGERQFWQCVQDGTPPAPVTYEECVQRYRIAGAASPVEATPEILAAFGELKITRAAKKADEEREAELKGIIARFLGENEADTLTIDGRVAVTWKERKGSQRVDTQLLKASFPEAAAACTVQGDSTRTFLVK